MFISRKNQGQFKIINYTVINILILFIIMSRIIKISKVPGERAVYIGGIKINIYIERIKQLWNYFSVSSRDLLHIIVYNHIRHLNTLFYGLDIRYGIVQFKTNNICVLQSLYYTFHGSNKLVPRLEEKNLRYYHYTLIMYSQYVLYKS